MEKEKPMPTYMAQYVSLNKNYCHNPLFAPPSKELDVEALEIPEYDDNGNLTGYKVKRIYGTINGTSNENEELEKGCIVGCEKGQIKKYREFFPEVKIRFGRGLSSFDRKVLLRLLGQVQYQKIVAKEFGRADSVENYKLFFSDLNGIGKFLELSNASQYKHRILESLCKLAASGAWFVNSYYESRKKRNDRGKKGLVRGICHFNFIDYLNITPENIVIQLSPGWVDSHEGYFITAYFKKDEELKSEISFNLKNLLEAHSERYGKGKGKITVLKPITRELFKLCQKLGFNENVEATELRRGLRESIFEINNIYEKDYRISFEKNKDNEEMVTFTEDLASEIGGYDRFADEGAKNVRHGRKCSCQACWLRRRHMKKIQSTSE